MFFLPYQNVDVIAVMLHNVDVYFVNKIQQIWWNPPFVPPRILSKRGRKILDLCSTVLWELVYIAVILLFMGHIWISIASLQAGAYPGANPLTSDSFAL